MCLVVVCLNVSDACLQSRLAVGQFVRADQHLNVGLSSYQPDSSVYGDSRGAGILEGQDYDSASCQDSLLTYPSHSAGIARNLKIPN